MSKQTIGVGTTANDGTGDPLRTAMIKVNENFDEIYLNNPQGLTENVDYFLYEKPGYIPYPYPHPLTIPKLLWLITIPDIGIILYKILKKKLHLLFLIYDS